MTKNKTELIKELKSNSINITKDNIHLYYEFMNTDDLNEYSSLISKSLNSRFGAICSCLNLDVTSLQSNMEFEYIRRDTVRQFVFGVKDNLKPINGYVQKIRESIEIKTQKESTEEVIKNNDLIKLDKSKCKELNLSILDWDDKGEMEEIECIFAKKENYIIDGFQYSVYLKFKDTVPKHYLDCELNELTIEETRE